MALTQLPSAVPSEASSSAPFAARTYARSLPVVPVRARGLTIEGADGRRYLDCLSGAGALALGHNHPVVLEAIRSVLDSGAPLHAPGLATPVQDAFTGELFATLPRGLAESGRVLFCAPGGSDALDTAARLVRSATGRDGPLLARRPEGPCDAPGGPEPAGILVEAVQGRDGVQPAPDAWLRRVRADATARALPLVADETETGVGRTGAFWAVGHSGIVPDVMVLSKAIGGSLPLAVVVHHDSLGSGQPADPAGIFRGNQLAMAAGTATLRYVREHGLAERAAVLGERLLNGLRPLAHAYGCVQDVRGRGLMIGVACADPEAPNDATGRSAALAQAATVQQECLRRGLIVELTGRCSSEIRLMPPLTITDEQADAVLDRLSDAIATVSRTSRRIPTPRTPKEAGAASPARRP
ncbi:aminotransferase class III-fold pyridoxal phosphate-dependent enzyme [Streptomyces sp. NPDC001262]|uniref:aminotransferase class III-fold pyridoxal phosphate-dependent enzyme n=1 Tax=Streptomyces sp. NPDC001262 TaxID=3364552 RepID=UPI0036C8B487